MKPEEAFACWAPDRSPWSDWAKPVGFLQPVFQPAYTEPPAAPPALAAPWAPATRAERRLGDGAGYRAGALVGGERAAELAAVVVELVGPRAVGAGLALARAGYFPVPLFNAVDGPLAVVDVRGIHAALLGGAVELARALDAVPDDAPPAFLIDAARQGTRRAAPRELDNRSVVFPQDFPSAVRLRGAGVTRVLWVREPGAEGPPARDLGVVLYGYQEGGLRIEQVAATSDARPRPVTIDRPMGFGSLRRWSVQLGLARSPAGGFGNVVPVPPAGGWSG
jgi:hypothetical protein